MSSLLGGIIGILLLIPFRKYFVSDMHGKYPFPEATATTQVLVSGEKGGSQAKPLIFAGLIGGLYDFIIATFGWWGETISTRIVGAGEMLAEKAKIVLKVNTGAAVLGLGYIIGLKYSLIICAGSFFGMVGDHPRHVRHFQRRRTLRSAMTLSRRPSGHERRANLHHLCPPHRYRRYRYRRGDRHHQLLGESSKEP